MRKNNKPTILLDIDDTLNNLKEVWIDLYNKLYKDDLDHNLITDWDISRFVKPEAKRGIYDILRTPTLFSKMVTPLPHSEDVVCWLAERAKLYIVSYSVYPSIIYEKMEWMTKYFPCIDQGNLIFCKDKSMIKGDYLIDDHYKNLEHFDGKRLLMYASHNSTYKTNGKMFRVDGWLEIKDYFEKEFDKNVSGKKVQTGMFAWNDTIQKMN
jgi:5'(3')-deoxyribonucleotidase